MARKKAQTSSLSSRRGWWPLVAILALGCLLRLLYLLEIKETPEFSNPLIDAEFHQYWGRAMVTGDWTPPHGQPDPQIRTTPFMRPPGYPFFLAAVYRIAGVGYLTPRIAQMMLGLASCLIAYFLARTWYGRGVGFVYALLMATHWSFIYFEAQFLEPSLLIFLLLSAVYTLGRWMRLGARKYAVLCGVALGLAAAVRPNVLLLIPVALVWMIRVRKTGTTRKHAALDGLLMLAGALLSIAPLTVRNAIVADDFVLISANAGVNLFIGNNESADGFYFGGLEGVGDFGTCYDYPRLVRTVEREVGRSMKYSEVSRYFTRRAIEFAVSHPLDILSLTIRKAWMFWAPYEISHNYVVAYDRESSRLLRHLPFGFPLVASGFLLGLIVCGTRWREVRTAPDESDTQRYRITLLVLAFTVVYAASFMPFFNAALYRMPVIPLLMLFVAIAIRHLWLTLSQRNLRKSALWGLSWAALYAVCAAPLVAYEPDRTEWLHKKGIALARSGKPAEATRLYQEALSDSPENIRIRCALAEALLKAGKSEAALGEWAEALRYDPRNPAIHSDLGNTLRLLGRIEEAARAYAAAVDLGVDFVAPYFNLANIHAMRGHFDRAIELFRAGLKINSQACPGRMGLGLALARSGRTDEGIAHCSEAVRVCPDSIDARMNLGIVLVNGGKAEEAIPHYLHVLALAPGHPYASHNLGSAYEQLQKPAEAETWYKRALAVEPDLDLSLRNLGLLLLNRDRPAEAVPLLARVCELNPSDTEARMALAGAFSTIGDPVRAAEQYRAVLAIEPDNAAALQAIEALQNQ